MIKLQQFLEKRGDLIFHGCVMICLGNKEFVTQFDRLTGTNISKKGTPIEILVDESTGYFDKGFREFLEFCWDYIFMSYSIGKRK